MTSYSNDWHTMDKKAKKKAEILRKRLEKTQIQLKGAREQMDDPGEVVALENEIEKLHSDINELKNS
ncbi:MAG: hypothetical protein P8K79_05190 [Mariniblastus sp.]|nr:hypothetical protein [Mariniblastus sp.]